MSNYFPGTGGLDHVEDSGKVESRVLGDLENVLGWVEF